MCPDRQMLSLYVDGELPSPWKEKLESHLESCPDCRAVLVGYRSLGGIIEGQAAVKLPPDETILAAQERVWKNLGFAEPAAGTRAEARTLWAQPGKRVWNRTVTLPLPAAAAAAAVFILAVFLAVAGPESNSRAAPQELMAVGSIELDDYGTIPILPIQDMNGVLQYLSSLDNSDTMVIQLPESRRFSRSGEPVLVRAADYRSTVSR